MQLDNIKIIDIKDVDSSYAFFHYTNINNLESIDKNGLVPKIGNNSTGIEKTKKIFFAVGEKGVLAIMDAWIRWLIAKRLTDLPGEKMDISFYRLCTFIMRMPIIRYIIALIVRGIVWAELKIKFFKIKSFKIMKDILDTSVFFKLDLEENIDFSYTDIDEVKSQKFDKKMLSMVYAKMRKMDSKKMDFWNMHTFSDVQIKQEKITLLKVDDSFNGMDILKYIIANTKVDIKVFAPYLYEFLEYYEIV